MSMIIVRGGFNAWPDLLTFLTNSLQPAWLAQHVAHLDPAQHASIVENAILAISIIVEDCSSLFQEDTYVNIIEYMLQPVFNLLNPTTTISSNAIKAHAVNTINMLLTQCQSVRQYMQDYTVHIISLYQDASIDQQLKLRILEGLTTIMEFMDEVVFANLQPVLQMMTQALKEYDQVVALAASEFFASMIHVWFTLAMDDANDETMSQKVD